VTFHFRTFAATNAPGTCKWCGRKLRQKHRTRKEPTGKYRPPPSCHFCDANADWTAASEEGWFVCGGCDNASCGRQVYKIVERKKAYDKPGDYGDGHFCGLRCGYDFAVAFANAGKLIR